MTTDYFKLFCWIACGKGTIEDAFNIPKTSPVGLDTGRVREESPQTDSRNSGDPRLDCGADSHLDGHQKVD
jgi:hypothetical protein